jgi:LDH2 family malate/lactate/ureidoglycolate dehydrogenase
LAHGSPGPSPNYDHLKEGFIIDNYKRGFRKSHRLKLIEYAKICQKNLFQNFHKAQFSMDIAIKKAKENGIGWVCAKGANHFSIAGHWALMAEKEGLIGMAFTNTSPKVSIIWEEK